ncbi:indolepyruvate ferredoxin oxidoreductase family protein [Streptomyces sp. SID5914]|nr:indolepyruvate ferredoxin oxidoreductase family protein [Streptomyces sp. SID5914]MZG16358.1 indolepyruvate ferredoxin oxidoreductase family protein [Streptomyces sp. SID5914]
MTLASRLSDRYLLEHGTVQLTGVQALARLPIDLRRADDRAGRSTAAFISGYEGSPLAGYDMELARNVELLDAHDIVFRPAVNEELAATAVQGTQLAAMQPDKRVAGITAFWYGKSPGLDRASDAFRHGNLMGAHPDGGVLALVGDDPAAKSSTVPGASEPLLADLGLPTLFPADPQQVLDFGLHGAAISRASGLWVALKITTNVADGSGTVDLDPDRVTPVLLGPAYRHEVTAKVLQPTLGALERSRDGERLEIARRYAAANGLNRITRTSPADRIGIIAPGKTYLDVRQALRVLGLTEDAPVRLLQLGMIFPLEPEIITEFAAGLTEIIVVEEKRPFIETAVKDQLYGRADAPAVHGKRHPDGSALFPMDGELDPDLIAARLARLDAFPDHRAEPVRTMLPLVTRTPYFCSGCPHNSSAKTPAGATVGAGIGCHGMVTMMSPAQVGDVIGMTQMGGEGAQWIGMQPFLERDHLIQNLGDGTYHHSGSLAIRGAVAAGAHVTYKLLYNSAVAMTGGQQAVGAMTVPRICASLLAEGVRRIIVTTDDTRRYRRVRLPKGVRVWHRDRLVEAQQALADVDGVTVLIHDQECAAELRRKRKRGLTPRPTHRVMINERVCEGCGDCGQKSNCLSVQPVATEFGRKTRIDQSSCNLDFSCLAGDCPAFVTVVPATDTVKTTRRPRPAIPDLPEPPLAAMPQNIRITGVGGTGVVTLAQILSHAATLTGGHVRALDQTGLAQKGGAVVSDIKITDSRVEQAHKAAAEECDLYLGCDLLVSADPRYLSAVTGGRTTALVSTMEIPTGQMVVDPGVAFPHAESLTSAIETAARRAFFLDAHRLADTLLGSAQSANMLLAGAAFQTGALPFPASAIEQAITLNGTQVDANLQAFRLGRLAIADPDAVAEMTVPRPEARTAHDLGIGTVAADEGSELARLVSLRIPDLSAYQNTRYAHAYAELVERVRQAETQRVPGATALAEAAARYLYKLMAYKDEYEVARLALDPAAEATVHTRFGAGARMSYRLHPPVLRALGMKSKLTLGPWFRPVLRTLVALRGLRGTPLDPFGPTRVRRVERALISEYRQTLERLIADLTPDNHAVAVQIAQLPDLIRGYEHIKLANVDHYRRESSRLLAEFSSHTESDLAR